MKNRISTFLACAAFLPGAAGSSFATPVAEVSPVLVGVLSAPVGFSGAAIPALSASPALFAAPAALSAFAAPLQAPAAFGAGRFAAPAARPAALPAPAAFAAAASPRPAQPAQDESSAARWGGMFDGSTARPAVFAPSVSADRVVRTAAAMASPGNANKLIEAFFRANPDLPVGDVRALLSALRPAGSGTSYSRVDVRDRMLAGLMRGRLGALTPESAVRLARAQSEPSAANRLIEEFAAARRRELSWGEVRVLLAGLSAAGSETDDSRQAARERLAATFMAERGGDAAPAVVAEAAGLIAAPAAGNALIEKAFRARRDRLTPEGMATLLSALRPTPDGSEKAARERLWRDYLKRRADSVRPGSAARAAAVQPRAAAGNRMIEQYYRSFPERTSWQGVKTLFSGLRAAPSASGRSRVQVRERISEDFLKRRFLSLSVAAAVDFARSRFEPGETNRLIARWFFANRSRMTGSSVAALVAGLRAAGSASGHSRVETSERILGAWKAGKDR